MCPLKFSIRIPRPWGLPPDYYFCIRKHIYKGESNRKAYCYVDVVKLGLLTDDEASMIFKQTIRPLIDIIDNNKIETEYLVTDLWQSFGANKLESGKIVEDSKTKTGLWQSLIVSEFEPSETIKDWKADLDLQKLSAAMLLRWNMMSESFFRGRYQAALRQHDQTGFSKPTNETILAAAV